MRVSNGQPGAEDRPTDLWPRLRALVVAGAGAAIILGAIGWFSGQLTGAAPAHSTPRNNGLPLGRTTTSQGPPRVVLVETVAEQERLQAQFAKDRSSLGLQGQASFRPPLVVVIGSRLYASLISASGDVAGSGTTVQATEVEVLVTPDSDAAGTLVSTSR